MFVNEYRPSCGWLKYNRRKAILGKAKAIGAFMFLLVVCVISGQIEMGV